MRLARATRGLKESPGLRRRSHRAFAIGNALLRGGRLVPGCSCWKRAPARLIALEEADAGPDFTGPARAHARRGPQPLLFPDPLDLLERTNGERVRDPLRGNVTQPLGELARAMGSEHPNP